MNDRNLYLPVTRQVIEDRIRATKALLAEAKHGKRETDLTPEQIQRVLGALELAQQAILRRRTQ